MASFILLAHFTEQGIKNVKDSPKRADAFRQSAKKRGATVKEIFWTLGQYDLVAILDAPDDVTVTALGLSLGTLGNVRTQTLRAFSEAEMAAVLGKMA
ncbi:MAG: GYD domain-containing protein [Rhodoplanes sp.]